MYFSTFFPLNFPEQVNNKMCIVYEFTTTLCLRMWFILYCLSEFLFCHKQTSSQQTVEYFSGSCPFSFHYLTRFYQFSSVTKYIWDRCQNFKEDLFQNIHKKAKKKIQFYHLSDLLGIVRHLFFSQKLRYLYVFNFGPGLLGAFFLVISLDKSFQPTSASTCCNIRKAWEKILMCLLIFI